MPRHELGTQAQHEPLESLQRIARPGRVDREDSNLLLIDVLELIEVVRQSIGRREVLEADAKGGCPQHDAAKGPDIHGPIRHSMHADDEAAVLE